ncbi:hypothetical protein Pmar_PMAR011590 [Perkinsus marinus ATCC 50983]|uniref:Uncharacterized protein n=1 Tax=Perkinsus marinus (strain ATCC 50983 / TXsc) TaxID=423536 RepID=C5LC79_PERM5|nr:hypothetical protein Pmar_PMAR011590 [Perkinsus marinus ATCC 50983]EER05562.1 hypothetical protein Pmar_PMAR011590 [Perkinsus marinus ATCC 50983]|eukprot:XP_002773746.1 hypothetical protein Pmar_PMAR011590 [Perkinsus marinus ATCC 50983]
MFQTHAERTQRLSEAIMKAGAEQERIIQDVSEATATVVEVAREKDRAEQEVATAQSELKAKSREIEMCLTLIGGHYDHGHVTR